MPGDGGKQTVIDRSRGDTSRIRTIVSSRLEEQQQHRPR